MLKRLSKYSIIAISYIFIIRLFGTVFGKNFSSNVYFAAFTEFLFILSVLILGLFFYYFTKEYAEKIDSPFKIISFLPVFGYTLLLITHFIRFLNILIKTFNFPLIGNLVFFIIPSLINPIFLLIFFMYFYFKIKDKDTLLKRSVLFAAIGVFLFVFLFLAYGFFTLKSYKFSLFFPASFLIFIIQYITYFNFFYEFQKKLE